MQGEEWEPLDRQGFPGHSISNYGRVLNDNSKRFLALSKNQQGFVKVAIVTEEHGRLTVQVNRLVARAFIQGETEIFNNIIHLNGVRDQTYAANLAWRPRWFALKYHKQFEDRPPFVPEPVLVVDTREEFQDSRRAAMTYGLLEKDIFRSTCMPDLRVFPHGFRFRLLREV